jgi:hypothetical protein
MVDLSKLCRAVQPVTLVALPGHAGVVTTHRREGAPHVCTLEKGHKGKHRCGMMTNEVWEQYCHKEW